MKKIDPIERALDAYFELDTDQKEAFDVLVRISKKQAAKLYAGLTPEAPAPKVGRPKGSKNRKAPAYMDDLINEADKVSL